MVITHQHIGQSNTFLLVAFTFKSTLLVFNRKETGFCRMTHNLTRCDSIKQKLTQSVIGESSNHKRSYCCPLKLRLLMCGCGVPVSMPCGRCAEISLYCVYRCCINLPSQTLVRLQEQRLQCGISC